MKWNNCFHFFGTSNYGTSNYDRDIRHTSWQAFLHPCSAYAFPYRRITQKVWQNITYLRLSSPFFKTLPPLIQIVKGRVPLQAWVADWTLQKMWDLPIRLIGPCCGKPCNCWNLFAEAISFVWSNWTFLIITWPLFSSHGPSLIWELGSSYKIHPVFA